MSTTTAPDATVADRIAGEVERAIRRNVKGLEYLASPAPVVGSTPKDLLYKRGTLNLYHYHAMVDEIYRVPILIVMATSNRGYILDLAPGQSFVEFLLKSGYDVYLIDWSPPSAEEKSLRFEDYTLDFIPECVRRVRKDSGVKDLTLMGYCMGGVLSTIYTAIHPKTQPKNFICFTTPISFSNMELFAKWSDKRYFDVDRLVDTLGNVPSEMIFSSFDMLRPASRIAGQLQLWENMWSDEYVKSFRMFERWSTDTLPLAGEYFRQTVKELIWKNSLDKGQMMVGGRRADLHNITAPILHVVAEHDHIVPYAASKALIEQVSSTDKEEVVLKGGHISVVAGANAQKRLWPRLDAWLGARSV
jgi:polyhydroxyalkanoate synthase subunit PhaC